jgi:transposase-like protein
MTCNIESNQFDLAMELLIENGFDGIADAVSVLMNTAMKIERSRYLQAEHYQRTEQRQSYANGYKAKTVKTRIGKVDLAVPQTRDCEFYPHSLERGLRSERALKIALAEMYVQGVSTRKVAKITQELCGFEINSTEVSRASKTLDDQLQAWRERPFGEIPLCIHGCQV